MINRDGGSGLGMIRGPMNRLHRWYCQSNHWRLRLGTEILPWSLKGVDLGSAVLELGPGPGLTTDWLHHYCGHITCLEVDPNLARSLRQRLPDANVTVQIADATATPFDDRVFSAALSFTMLHHISSSALQDRLFGKLTGFSSRAEPSPARIVWGPCGCRYST